MATDGRPYTRAELMVTAAAREIHDGDVVFVGMRLPLLGFQLAKSTHAPNAVGVYELGITRDSPAPAPILTMGDLPNLYRAQWLADTADVMGLLQRGRVDVSFIGGAEVDRFGNLNTTYIGGTEPGRIETRLPGSGGACDLASLARRHIIIMAHERRRFVPRVAYVTSPGYGEGAGWRERVGLRWGGPVAVITTLGVLRFDPDTREMILASIHPGVAVEAVLDATGWPLRVPSPFDCRSGSLRTGAADLAPSATPEPTPEELAMLRRFNPQGFWTGD